MSVSRPFGPRQRNATARTTSPGLLRLIARTRTFIPVNCGDRRRGRPGSPAAVALEVLNRLWLGGRLWLGAFLNLVLEPERPGTARRAAPTTRALHLIRRPAAAAGSGTPEPVDGRYCQIVQRSSPRRVRPARTQRPSSRRSGEGDWPSTPIEVRTPAWLFRCARRLCAGHRYRIVS